MLKEGTVIAGRYRLDNLIGEGAMGEVWQAMDETLRRNIAIKMLFLRPGRDTQGMVDQFLREARIAASVQHRNVIQTVDFGIHDDNLPFMVMELLNGEALEDRLEAEPPPTPQEFVQIASLTLRGLAAVHDAGIVHRDLKPSNIFLQREPEGVFPKIIDFGISRSLEGPSAVKTQEGLIVGTPDYMSPEQARGEGDIDRRSDIYSMGVMLYQGLSGQLPFVAATIGELIVKIVTETPPPLKEVAPHVPEIFSDVIEQAMARDREHRFVDARVMRNALTGAVKRAALKPRAPSAPKFEPGTEPPFIQPPAAPSPPVPEPVRAASLDAGPPTPHLGAGPPPPVSLGAPPPVSLADPPKDSWSTFGGSLPGGGGPGPGTGDAPPPLSDFSTSDPFDLDSGGDRLTLDMPEANKGPGGAPPGRGGLPAPVRADPSTGNFSVDPFSGGGGGGGGGGGDVSGGFGGAFGAPTQGPRLQLERPDRSRPRKAPPRQRVRQQLRRRKRSPVPLIIAVLMLLGLLYAPRMLLAPQPSLPAAQPEYAAEAAPGRSHTDRRRSDLQRRPPQLRDVLF